LLEAVEATRRGEPFLLFDADDREGETDIVVPAHSVSYEDIRFMREEAGGLVCVAISPEAADELGLPFARDVLSEFDEDVDYDDTSSFSVWVNHKDAFTGITDRDRALTASKISEAVESALNGGFEFREAFSVPGHVPVLRGAEGLSASRQGQTELSLEIAEAAGVTPAMIVCEMLDGETGYALSKEDAVAFAEEHGLPFVEGSDVVRSSAETSPHLTEAEYPAVK